MRTALTRRFFMLALAIGAVLFIGVTLWHNAVRRHAVEGGPVGMTPRLMPLMIAAKGVPNPAAAAESAVNNAAQIADTEQIAQAPPSLPRFVPLPPRGGRGPSQLIRTANVSVEVSDVTRALRDATLITDEELGDVIGLNDESPSSPDEVHTATMALRVPQYRFEQTLDVLGRLGKVTAKSVNAQDVSDQLVDAQARLRNLRRTETDMLGIMDRSGNIDQVLNVTQQISSVREQIERLDAQIQSMQYQVAYSTVNITFSSPVVVTTPTGWAVLGVAWQHATAAARDFGISLVSFALWLIAFAPYALVAALAIWFAIRRVRTLVTVGPKSTA
ncbi:MAG: DUF4349 domain-containing protein [Candidatus Eremiobacteraeota bacterium]|nr:DUF4349 domain-containing protein [Candidatus Eremiobacteraeota bacterium]